jgi:uncharacterized protein (DUF1501 family)
LVVVFLRGAMDGLSLLPPGAASPFRADYEANRSNTRVPTSGTGAALALPNTTWALHPRATGLQALYQANHLGIVVAAGQLAPGGSRLSPSIAPRKKTTMSVSSLATAGISGGVAKYAFARLPMPPATAATQQLLRKSRR